MNNPVSFELAKLLKEKRYVKPCLKCYLEDGSIQISSGDESDLEEYNHNQWDNYSAPTIAEVVMWLYEKHNVWINVNITRYGKFWCNLIIREDCKNIDNPFTWEFINQLNDFKSPTEAYESAIEYFLTNII